jgi:copper transport protein
MTPRGLRLLLGAFVCSFFGAAVLVLLTVPAASAHDELVATVPGAGFTVNELPGAMRFTFAEETAPDDVTVKYGARVLPVTAVPGNDHEISVGLAGVPATETVSLTWRAVDEHDGHVTSGTVAFHLLDHISGTPAPSPTATPAAAPFTSVPADGFTVTTLPAAATFTFPANVDPADLTVRDGNRTLAVTAVAGKPGALSISLKGVRATETVSLAWRLAGQHGAKATSGTISFHVLEHVAGAASAGSSSGPTQKLHGLSVLTHVVGYLAMAVMLGGLFFVSVLWPAGAAERRTRMLIGSAVVAGLLSAAGSVYVTTQQVTPLSFRDAIAQHFGRVSVALTLMWLLASVVVVGMMQHPGVVRRTAWRLGAVVVGAGLIRAVGMSAHDTQGAHQVSGVIVDFLHLTAVSAWVGGLVVLTVGLLPRRRLGELEEVVPRFSRVAATSVALVVASGVVMAWQLVGSVGDLFSTHYGRVLLVKLLLVGFVLLAAVASKRWVSRTLASAVAADRNGAIGSIVASVGAETALVIGVLGVASLLVTSNPGL